MFANASRKRFVRVAVFLLATSFVAAGTSADEYTSLVKAALEEPDFDWRSTESGKVRVFYKPDSFAKRHRMTLLRSANATVEEVTKLFDEPEYDRILNIFYVDSREEMNTLVGMPATGYADWTGSGIFLVVSPEWRSFEKHEFAHIITMGAWGRPDPTSRWMTEGIAIYADGWCRESTTDEIAYHFLSRGRLPKLPELFDDYATLGEIRAGFYAASVIGYIHDTYGTDALRKVWTGGCGDLSETLGVDVHQLESAWREYLRRVVDDDVEVDMKSIEEFGCG
jgi:hypothetical protein